MGSIRVRKENGLLFFDFRYQGARCREQTLLKDTVQNRKVMKKVLEQIEGDIALGIFDYAKYFPKSNLVVRSNTTEVQKEIAPEIAGSVPLFKTFAEEWFEENSVRWKRSYRSTLQCTLNHHLLPTKWQ
jgi:integrase